eukprot:6192441-Pleurochrysis_carterae.AAC.2
MATSATYIQLTDMQVGKEKERHLHASFAKACWCCCTTLCAAQMAKEPRLSAAERLGDQQQAARSARPQCGPPWR